MSYEFTKAKIKREKSSKLKSQLLKVLVLWAAGAAGSGWGHWMLSLSMPFVFFPGIVLLIITGIFILSPAEVRGKE